MLVLFEGLESRVVFARYPVCWAHVRLEAWDVAVKVELGIELARRRMDWVHDRWGTAIGAATAGTT